MNDRTDRSTADSTQVLRRVADLVPSMLAYWDRDLLCRFANRAYETWFGIDPNALIGTSLRELLGPDLFALNQPHIEAALRGEPQVFERRIERADGTGCNGLAHYLPDVVDGRVAGFVVQVTDIESLKQTEAALRDSEQRYRMLSELSPVAVYHAQAQGAVSYANARWDAIFGLEAAQSLGHAWRRAVHPDDQSTLFAALEAAVAANHEFELAFRIVRPGGEVRTVRALARPVPSATPATQPGAEYVGMLEDITEQRQVEERLRASENFLDRTGRIARIGGWEVDLRSQHVYWSARTRLIHEVAEDYVPTVETAINFYAPEARPVISAALQTAIQTGAPWDLEMPFVTARGRAIWVRAYGEVEYEAGQAVRLFGAFQDITEQRQRRAELLHEQALRDEVERHSRVLNRLLNERSEMLDVLAHEVRQPLHNAAASLQSAAATLAEFGEAVASQRLHRAQAVMGQVLASIDNTLAVATLLAHAEPIHREDTDLDTLIAIAIADMPASERGRIRVERGDAPHSVLVDMSLMRLALRNLLSNALKFSAAGTPVVVQLSEDEATQALLINVIDRGPGIPPAGVAQLFQRGVRSAVPAGAPNGGLGLGLYIVRRVMALHGGRAELAANTAAGVTMRLVVGPEQAD